MSGIAQSTGLLSDVEANQAADILVHAGRSPRWQTRKNAAIAWSVLAGMARERGGKERAVEGLVNTAVNALEGGSHVDEVMRTVAREIAGIDDPALVEHAYAHALELARSPLPERNDAARFAMLIWQVLPMNRRLQALLPLWLARVGALAETWRRCLFPVGIAALGFTMLLWLLLYAQTKGTSVSAGLGIEAAALPLIAGLLAAGLGMPSPFFTGRIAPLIEVFAQAILVSVPTYFAASVIMRQAGLLTILPSEEPPDANMVEVLLDMLVLAGGVGTARLAAMGLSINRSFLRQMIGLPLVAGGAGAGVILLAAVLLYRFGGRDEAAISGRWMLWSLATLGAACGMAWAETRAAHPLVPKGDTWQRGPQRVWIARLSIVAMAGFFIVFMVSAMRLKTDLTNNVEKWRAAAKRSAAEIGIDCKAMAGDKQLSLSLGTKIVPLSNCAGRKIAISVEKPGDGETSLRSRFFGAPAALFLLDATAQHFDTDIGDVSIPTFPVDATYYLCVVPMGNQECGRTTQKTRLQNEVVARLAGLGSDMPEPGNPPFKVPTMEGLTLKISVRKSDSFRKVGVAF